MIKFKLIEELDEQGVFNHVVNHLRTQKVQSVSDNIDSSCKYRLEVFGGPTLSCAAGCLIDDSEYNIAMEGQTWKQMVSSGKISDRHEALIQSLQMLHDGNLPDHWEYKFIEIANKYNLKLEPLSA